MSIILPDWVAHYGDDKKVKRGTIFSVSVHPDGSRLATAGLDSKIRIWATLPILDADVHAQPDSHKLLSTLDRHTGSVLVVRWSNSGRFLASGSDDTIALVWDLDTTGLGIGGSFGSTEVNVESWRPHRRLVGHESDVVDIAWSSDDEYVATVGLDSLAFVWSGSTFERIRKIDGHQGFVKGVVFDPLGQYLATASDDKTVKVWRTADWGLAADIAAPFETSPSSTFFRRPSWSPDGSLLACANAMSGPVFVSSVVKRADWSSDVSFVGHENSVIVAAFSPKIFAGFDGGSHACVVALGSMDQSVSIWVTGLDHPMLVARDLFERQVVDLSWSADGYTLYASSSDGTVAVITLTPEYLSEALSDDRLQATRAKHGYKRVRTHVPLHNLSQTVGTHDRPNVLQVRKAGSARPNVPLVRPAPSRTERLKQEITITRDGKRRIKPTQISSDGYPSDFGEQYNGFRGGGAGVNGGGGSVNGISSGAAQANTSMDISMDLGHQHHRRPSSSGGAASRMMIPRGSPALAIEDTMARMMAVFVETQQQMQQQQSQQFQQLLEAQTRAVAARAPQSEVQSAPAVTVPAVDRQDAATDSAALEPRGEKRKASFDNVDIEPLSKIPRSRTKAEIGKTLGGDVPRESMGRPMVVRRRIEGSTGIVEDGVRRGVRLDVPELLSVYRRESQDGGGTIEIRNFGPSRPSEIALLDGSDNDSVVWLDFSPSPGLLGTATSSFSAVALEDNSILLYSAKGRRMGNIYLDAPCFRLESSGHALMAITVAGMMHRWDTRADTEIHRPVSLLHLLGDPSVLLSTSIHANGAPIILLRTEKAYTFDDKKLAWTCVGDGWFAEHSQAWDGKTRGRGTDQAMVRDPVKAIEAEINNLVVARRQRQTPDGEEEDDHEDEENEEDGDEEREEGGDDAAAMSTEGDGDAATTAKVDGTPSKMKASDGEEEMSDQPGSGGGGGEMTRSSSTTQGRVKQSVPADRQKDFELAVTLRHLETRLLAARIFGSSNEYKLFLVAYARRLAEEGIKNQSEDLIKSLIGPIYHKPGLEDEWEPTIVGHDKRQLLGTVLQILAKPRNLTSLVQPYQDILNQMKN